MKVNELFKNHDKNSFGEFSNNDYYEMYVLAKQLEKENNAMREVWITDRCKCTGCGTKFSPFNEEYVKGQITFGVFFDEKKYDPEHEWNK